MERKMYIQRLKDIFLKDKVFTVQDCITPLGLSSSRKTAQVLSRLAKQGHLKRIKRGVYLPVSNKALTPDESYADPWTVLPVVFPKSYIGGWSAANFWQLTEQIFNTTCIITTTRVPYRSRNLGRFKYSIFKIKEYDYFGVDHVLKDHVKIPISDVHKTIIDIIQNPECGGGVQHAIDCFKEYLSIHYDELIFINYASQIKNGSFFKKLGYISEKLLGDSHPLCKLAKERITKGYSYFGSRKAPHTLITRWNLYINESLDL
jgi:predicted transcriptional regulator of viral defense system